MYYTYAHYTPKGEIFYIGKGKDERAFSRSDRSYKWREVVKNARGIIVQILADWNTEKEAFDHEKLLVSCFKDMGANLVNQTDGGAGVKNYMQSPESREKKSLLMRGYKHKIINCPVCKKSGGETSMKRWHFNKCNGNKQFKARATFDGKRIYLGKFETKELADQKIIDFYNSVNKPLPKEFLRLCSIKV
jgi:hypothetical protein